MAAEAERVTADRVAKREAKEAEQQRHAAEMASRLRRRASDVGGALARDTAKAAAAEVTAELEAERQAEAEAELQAEMEADAAAAERMELRDALRAATLASEREQLVAAKAAAKAEAAATAAARLARLSPRGVWLHGVPTEVLTEWARRAVKPSRDHFTRPMRVAPRHSAAGGDCVSARASAVAACGTTASWRGDGWQVVPPPSPMSTAPSPPPPADSHTRLHGRRPASARERPANVRDGSKWSSPRTEWSHVGGGPACFQPNSARAAGRRQSPRVPPAAVMMQRALMRNAPAQVRAFYQQCAEART